MDILDLDSNIAYNLYVQQNKAVFTDIDKTIFPNGSLNLLVQNFYKKKLLPIRLIFLVLYWYGLYKMNWINDFSKVIEKCNKVLNPMLTRNNVKELDALMKKWFDAEITPKIYPEIEQRIRKLHSDGHKVYFVSSTIDPVARLFRDYFGFGEIEATTLEQKDGFYTSYIQGTPCHGEEKVKRMKRLAKEENIDLEQSYSFTDHISDLPMLKIVGHPIVVNPKRLLKVIAKKNRWQILKL